MAINNSLVKKGEQKLGLTAYLTNDAVKTQIAKVVGGRNGDRFITSIISAVEANPDLRECTNSSIVSAALVGEALKLSPSPQLGHYYLVPYKNNKAKTKEAQFQLGYKGYLQLAMRSGQYEKINVLPIKEGELISYDPLEEIISVNLIEDEVVRENTPAVGYYAMFQYTKDFGGFKKTLYWSREKMESHALKYSQGYRAKKGCTFWEKDFDAMAMKTMLRQLISKWGIMSIDTPMAMAYESDMAVIREDGAKEYVDADVVEIDNVPESATQQPVEEQKEAEAVIDKVEPEKAENGQQAASAEETGGLSPENALFK